MSNVKLADPTKVYRDSANNIFVRGNAIVEVPDPMPQAVLSAIQAGKLQLTNEPAADNTYGRVVPGPVFPPIQPRWRDAKSAAQPVRDYAEAAPGVPVVGNAGPGQIVNPEGALNLTNNSTGTIASSSSPTPTGSAITDLTVPELEALLAAKKAEVETMQKQATAGGDTSTSALETPPDEQEPPPPADKGGDAKGQEASAGGSFENSPPPGETADESGGIGVVVATEGEASGTSIEDGQSLPDIHPPQDPTAQTPVIGGSAPKLPRNTSAGSGK